MRSILTVPLALPFIELSHRRQLLLRQNHSAAVGVYVFLKNIVGAIRSSINGRRKPDKVPFHPMASFSAVPFRVRRDCPTDLPQGASPEGVNIGNPQGGAVRCCRVRPPGNVLARTRVPYYSPCLLPSILHLLVYWVIIQMVTGEGKGVAAFTGEWRFFSFSCLPTMH